MWGAPPYKIILTSEFRLPASEFFFRDRGHRISPITADTYPYNRGIGLPSRRTESSFRPKAHPPVWR